MITLYLHILVLQNRERHRSTADDGDDDVSDNNAVGSRNTYHTLDDDKYSTSSRDSSPHNSSCKFYSNIYCRLTDSLFYIDGHL